MPVEVSALLGWGTAEVVGCSYLVTSTTTPRRWTGTVSKFYSKRVPSRLHARDAWFEFRLRHCLSWLRYYPPDKCRHCASFHINSSSLFILPLDTRSLANSQCLYVIHTWIKTSCIKYPPKKSDIIKGKGMINELWKKKLNFNNLCLRTDT